MPLEQEQTEETEDWAWVAGIQVDPASATKRWAVLMPEKAACILGRQLRCLRYLLFKRMDSIKPVRARPNGQ
jgi:hypothetical protein